MGNHGVGSVDNMGIMGLGQYSQHGLSWAWVSRHNMVIMGLGQ